MAKFDIILAAGKAYTTIWEERSYLARMAIVPIIVKIICMLVAVNYVEDVTLLRLTLIMLPAYFAEGWMLAHLVRLVVLGQRWPFKVTGDDKADAKNLYNRARGILSGMVSFVLINLILAAYFAFFMNFIPLEMNPEDTDPKVAMIGLGMMVSAFLGFRLVWFYVPLAVNVNPKLYLSQFSKSPTTFYLIGLWLVCFVPSMIGMQLLSSVVLDYSGVETVDDELSSVTESTLAVVKVLFDSMKNLFVTAGISYALLEMFKLKDPRGENNKKDHQD